MESSQHLTKQSSIDEALDDTLLKLSLETSGTEDLLRIQILSNADLLVNKLVTAIEARDVLTIKEQVDLLIKRPVKNVLGRLRKSRLTLDAVKKSLTQLIDKKESQ